MGTRGALLLVVAVMMVMWERAEGAITCKAVTTTRESTVTCYFGTDIFSTKHNFNLQFYYPDLHDEAETLLMCNWVTKEKTACRETQGIYFNHVIGDQVTVKGPPMTHKVGGKYVCQVVPAMDVPSRPCELTLSDVSTEQAPQLPGSKVIVHPDMLEEFREEIREEMREEVSKAVTLDKVALALAIVIIIVLVILVLLIVFLARLRRRIPCLRKYRDQETGMEMASAFSPTTCQQHPSQSQSPGQGPSADHAEDDDKNKSNKSGKWYHIFGFWKQTRDEASSDIEQRELQPLNGDNSMKAGPSTVGTRVSGRRYEEKAEVVCKELEKAEKKHEKEMKKAGKNAKKGNK